MGAYTVKRLLLMIPTLIGITLVTFLIIRLAPGDPAAMKVAAGLGGPGEAGGGGDSSVAREQAILKAKQRLGLVDENFEPIPIPTAYWSWLTRIVSLDFGRSFQDNRPVIDKLREALPITVKINLIVILLVYLISIPLGVQSAVHRNSIRDQIMTVVLFVLYSMPPFWVATMLIIALGSPAGWSGGVLPFVGLHTEEAANRPYTGYILDHWKHLVLPVLALTYRQFAFLSRIVRTSMLESLSQDYIRTARSKGLSERTVVWKHALRNALIPVITLLGTLLPALIGGSIIIERIYTIPGMGSLAFDAILARDYPVIMATTTCVAVLTVIGILISDLLYCLVDPRIRLH